MNSKYNSGYTVMRKNSKIDVMTEWWNDYQNVQKQQIDFFLNDFRNLEQEVYKWNGDTWKLSN